MHCPIATPHWLLWHGSSMPSLALPIPTPTLHPTRLLHRVQPVIFLPLFLPQMVEIFLLLIHASVTSFFSSTDTGCAHPRERLKPQAAALGTGPLPAMCCQLSHKPTSVLPEQTQTSPTVGVKYGKFQVFIFSLPP